MKIVNNELNENGDVVVDMASQPAIEDIPKEKQHRGDDDAAADDDDYKEKKTEGNDNNNTTTTTRGRVFPRSWQYLDAREDTTNCEDASRRPSFTVITYNILTDNCMPQGEYQYCPESVRYMANRHPHIMSELAVMKPDVLCLQEADSKHFDNLLLPDLKQQGCPAVYYKRADDQGIAIFYKSSVFSLLEQKHCVLHHLAERYIQKANISESTKESIRQCIKRPTASLMVRLRHQSSGHVVAIGNIHVCWKFLKYPALQALQISCATNELVEFAGGAENAHIICGDFNTPPHFPAYHMLTDGEMRDNTVGLLKGMTIAATKSDAMAAHGLVSHLPDAFKLKTDLKSAYKMITREEPVITNCDDYGLEERVELCLDYLWFSNQSLEVTGVLRTPRVEPILQHYALPSVLFPSDHIPLQARFAFR